MTKNLQSKKQLLKDRRKKRIRAKIKVRQRADRPRFSVYRSLKHIYAQIIDDKRGVTLVSASDRELSQDKKAKKSSQGRKEKVAREVGKIIAKKALAKKISRVVFDRGGRAYHGRVKALAEGAREGGLKF